MILAIRQFLDRVFGSEQVEQQYSVLESSKGAGEHYFPRDRKPNDADGVFEGDAARSRREPAFQGK